MESIALLFYFLMRSVIKYSIEKLEPFININEQDGIYFYRIIILLKMVFIIYTAESMFPDNDTWFFISVTNALTVIKYPRASVFLMAIQGLILPASSKKFALFSSAALFFMLSINIKLGEFLLDLYVVISLIMHFIKLSNHEHRRLWIFSTKILIFCYLYNLHTYNLRQLSLIVCFLFLNFIPLRLNIRNWYKRKLLYINTLTFIWLAVIKSAESHEVQTLTGNFEFYKKWGCYESSVISDNIEGKVSLQTFLNPKMMNISEAKLTPKFIFDNLTSYSEIKEICTADSEKNENTKIMDKRLKSLSIHESNLTGKVEAKNLDSMKLNCKNECSKDHKFNSMYDVEAPEENLSSKHFLEYFKENVLTSIDSENNGESYHSIDDNIFIKADKERNDHTRSMKNYIGIPQNQSDEIEEYNERKLSKAKYIERIATINEHNGSEESKSNMDEKDKFLPNVKEKNRMKDSLQDMSRREKKFTPVASDQVQKTSNRKVMHKVASFESHSIKSPETTDNVTFYERCLYEFGNLSNDEKIQQIEQMLIDISIRIEKLKVNIGSIHKIEKGIYVEESENGSLKEKDSFVEKDIGGTDNGKEVFKEENNIFKSVKSTKAVAKDRDDQKTSLILDEDIALQRILDSIQKKESKSESRIKDVSSAKKTEEVLVTVEERNAYKPTRETKQLLIFNNKQGTDWLKNEKKVIKYKEFLIVKDHKKPLILDEEITLRNILDSLQEGENKNKAKSKGISSITENGEILITSDEERNAYKPTKESKKLVIFSIRKYNERLKNQKNVVEYEESLLNESITPSKYGKNRLFTNDELKLHKNILNRETRNLATLKKTETRKRIILDVPHMLVFNTLRSVKRENNAQSSLKKKYLQIATDIRKYPRKQNNERKNDVRKKFQGEESNVLEKSELFENIELKNNVKLDNLLKIKKHSRRNLEKNPNKSSKFEKFNIIEIPKWKTYISYSLKKIIHQILISKSRRYSIHRENTYTRNT